MVGIVDHQSHTISILEHSIRRMQRLSHAHETIHGMSSASVQPHKLSRKILDSLFSACQSRDFAGQKDSTTRTPVGSGMHMDILKSP